MPEHLAPTGNYNEQVVRELRKYYHSHYNIEKKNNELIYISRQKAKKRKIVNEELLFPILSKHNFKIIEFEGKTFQELIFIAANAKVMISIHGAGLSNMLFMFQGAKILEIRKKGDKRNLCYFALSSALKLDYYYLFAEPVNPNEDFHTADLLVDPYEFEETIKFMLNQ